MSERLSFVPSDVLQHSINTSGPGVGSEAALEKHDLDNSRQNFLAAPTDLAPEIQQELFMAIKSGFEDLDLCNRFRWDELRVGVPDEKSSNFKVYEEILNIVAVQFGVIFEGYKDVEDLLKNLNFHNGSRSQDGSLNPVYTKRAIKNN